MGCHVSGNLGHCSVLLSLNSVALLEQVLVPAFNPSLMKE